MKKPNYNMERMERERAKQAKSAAKAESRALKRDENRQPAAAPVDDQVPSGDIQGHKQDG